MITLVFWFIVCVLLSAFFSGAEMAFVSSDRVKIREKADSGHRSAGRILKFYKTPQDFLTTILIGNNISNVTGTAIFTYILSDQFGIESELLVTLIMTPLLLLCAEILPKEYCRLHAQKTLLYSSMVLGAMSRSLHVVTRLIMRFVEFFLKPLGGSQKRSIFVSEQEFRFLIEESTKSGVVGKHEKKIIDTILDFEKMRVRAVMTPVDQVPKVEIHARVSDVKELARKTGAKMLLVYEEIPSIVVGMIYVFDLLFEDKENMGLKSFLRSPVFIRESSSNEMAFFTLQQRRQSYAVVVDADREVVGAVAIERLLAF